MQQLCRHRLVDTTIMVKNRLANRGGYSPVQRVFGFQPRLPGTFFTSDTNDYEVTKMDKSGDKAVMEAMDMRKASSRRTAIKH